MEAPVHASTVAVRQGGVWTAVAILGPSGSGKSDLALRLIGRGWRLVSDDYTRMWTSGGTLYAAAPESIAGRIEARGVGIVAMPTRSLARVALAVTCVQETVERLPEPRTTALAGAEIRVLALDPRSASAVEMVAAALQAL